MATTAQQKGVATADYDNPHIPPIMMGHTVVGVRRKHLHIS